jgi:hypothetical protein
MDTVEYLVPNSSPSVAEIVIANFKKNKAAGSGKNSGKTDPNRG